MRGRSCFCNTCRDASDGPCTNEAYAGAWAEHKVESYREHAAKERTADEQGLALAREIKLRPNVQHIVAVRYGVAPCSMNTAALMAACTKALPGEYVMPMPQFLSACYAWALIAGNQT